MIDNSRITSWLFTNANRVDQRGVMLCCFIAIYCLAHAGYAGFDGQQLSLTTSSPITAGQSLDFVVTVKNTGTLTWSGYTYPSWRFAIYWDDCSWDVDWGDITWNSWESISPGGTGSISADMTLEDDIPTKPGTYTFCVWAYRPQNTSGSYYVMVNSPMYATFTVLAAPTPTPTPTSEPFDWSLFIPAFRGHPTPQPKMFR